MWLPVSFLLSDLSVWNSLLGSNASDVTTLWHYTHRFIITSSIVCLKVPLKQ